MQQERNLTEQSLLITRGLEFIKYCFVITLFTFSINIYGQSDTILLNSYAQSRDSLNRRFLFKDHNGILLNTTIKVGQCYTLIRDGIIVDKKCYDHDRLISHLYSSGDKYIREESADTFKKVILNGYFDPEFSEESYKGGAPRLEGQYEEGNLILERYYKTNREFFSINYRKQIPDFTGDTIFGSKKPDYGLYFNHDTLFAIQNRQIVQYKSYKQGKLISYWSPERQMYWDNEDKLRKLRIYVKTKQIFDDNKDNYFEYYEFNESCKSELKVRVSDSKILSIEKKQLNRKTVLEYSYGRLKKGKSIEYFEGGCYVIIVEDGTARKYRVMNNSNGVSTQDEIKNFTFNTDSNFLKTGNLLTDDEYLIIENNVFE